jgi:2-polyprenyl-3-methyl-5-hydroxy-6-metoxy-1,4-benzoquinol methylase
MGRLMSFFPNQGKVLDLGCGHGLLIALLSRDETRTGLMLFGIDHDLSKIEIARRTAGPRATFSARPIQSFANSYFDAISIIDVLYTVKKQAWPQILDGCFRVMRPGATLILKEVIDQPRWKYRAIMAQERLAVRVLRITKGDRPHFESAETYRNSIQESGFALIDEQLLGSASWISHYLLIAQKPEPLQAAAQKARGRCGFICAPRGRGP